MMATTPGAAEQPPAPSVRPAPRRIVATTDVHSALDRAQALVSFLGAARADALIVDCGDFFEGSGYYALGGGRAETALLTGLYDAVAPGNHGYRHHLDGDLHSLTVCANIVDRAGATVFRRLRMSSVAGSSVVLTGVIGEAAFTAIPPGERAGHYVIDPARALTALHAAHRSAGESWVVLSHAGFDHDLALARSCPFLDVIFSGHCHRADCGPVRVGDVTVVKAPDLAAGYAVARPADGAWRAQVGTIPSAAVSGPAGALASVLDDVAAVGRLLTRPVGPVRASFGDRCGLLALVAARARRETGAAVAMFNETCLREAPLSSVLLLGDLMSLEPFGNRLTLVHAADPAELADYLSRRAGPMICDPDPPPRRPAAVVTTAYLRDTHLHGHHPVVSSERASALGVRDLVRAVLLRSSGSGR
jgi:2',3'-cyclic-nucleotide 2'-phosphodiesterase (5'-nucleotidase family)